MKIAEIEIRAIQIKEQLPEPSQEDNNFQQKHCRSMKRNAKDEYRESSQFGNYSN
jgi:hypothetical protein